MACNLGLSLSLFLGGISAFGSQDPAGPMAPYGDIFSGDPVPRVTCLRRCLNLGKHPVNRLLHVGEAVNLCHGFGLPRVQSSGVDRSQTGGHPAVCRIHVGATVVLSLIVQSIDRSIDRNHSITR